MLWSNLTVARAYSVAEGGRINLIWSFDEQAATTMIQEDVSKWVPLRRVPRRGRTETTSLEQEIFGVSHSRVVRDSHFEAGFIGEDDEDNFFTGGLEEQLEENQDIDGDGDVDADDLAAVGTSFQEELETPEGEVSISESEGDDDSEEFPILDQGPDGDAGGVSFDLAPREGDVGY